MSDFFVKQLPEDKTYLQHEKVILNYWETHSIPKNIQNNSQHYQQKFRFIDGPPFVSGNLHHGHLLVSVAKDTMIKYKTMTEHNCDNIQGFDCHGVPSEGYASKQLGVFTSTEIKNFGIENFNGFCKQMVHDCKKSWKPTFDKIGRWVDFDNVYTTMDTKFMETVWWVFGQLHAKGLIYEGFKVLPYSTHCETVFSNFEAGLNYKTINTKTLYIGFKSKTIPNTYFVAWTTTPFTLPSNIALCVGPSVQYMKCTDDKGISYIVAESNVNNLQKDFVTIEKFKLGKDMVGLEYEPLFNFITFTYHKIVSDSYVKDDGNIGTGIVHIAPTFGADDYRICIENNIIVPENLQDIETINSKGCYLEKITNYKDLYVFDAEKNIINDLKKTPNYIRSQDYSHEYPFCYRSDTPLIYRATSSFFVEVSKLSERMVELNDTINWSKEEIGKNRFKKWLEQAKDWCISRNRFFGTPIPVWKSDDGSESIVISSIEQLERLAKLDYKLTDLHLESVGNITIQSESGKILKLNGAVLDCWFESGSVPFGQIHYPFENSDIFDNEEFLCDFVVEGLDQTRGWFYTMLILSTAILDKAPFKNVICTGIVLDEHSQKMSKSKNNFVDPSILIDKYGSDTLRLFFLKSSLLNSEPLSFKESDVKIQFQQITPYVNVVKFFLEHFINSQTKSNPIEIEYLMNDEDYDNSIYTLMDLWILEQIWLLRVNVENHMNKFRIDIATKTVIDFIENLANWYVKFNRDRLKGLHGDTHYESSLSVLFTVLFDYCVISAPFMPFLSEHIYNYIGQILNDEKLESVHMEVYPDVKRQHHMTKSFEKLQIVSRLVRFLRDKSKTHTSIKTPIKKCTLYHSNNEYLNDLKQLVNVIEDELNCQEFEFVLIDSSKSNLVTYVVKPNFKLIGQTYKNLSKTITTKLSNLTQEELINLNNPNNANNDLTNVFVFDENNDKIYLDNKYFDIDVKLNCDMSTVNNIKSVSENGLIVSLDMTYDKDIHNTTEIKNLMKLVQNKRKIMKLNPWNKIKVEYYNTSLSEEFDNLIFNNQTLFFNKLGTNISKTEIAKDDFDIFVFKEFDEINVKILSEKQIMIMITQI